MTADDGPWRMFAHARNGSYQHFGARWWVEIHGLPDPVAAVRVSEAPPDADDDDVYWGWIFAADCNYPSRDGTPTMIWRHRAAFDAQFPYGADAEVERGRGRVVRLAVQEIAPEDDDER